MLCRGRITFGLFVSSLFCWSSAFAAATLTAQIKIQPPDDASVATSFANALIKDVESLREEYDDRYESATEARIELEDSFGKSQITWSRRYLDDWSGWVATDWSSAKEVYNKFIDDLSKPHDSEREKQSDESESYDYVNKQVRMYRLKQIHSLLGDLFQKRIETLSKQAVSMDAWKSSEFKDNTLRESAEKWKMRSNMVSRAIRELGDLDLSDPGASLRFDAMKHLIERIAEDHPQARAFLAAAKLRHATENARRVSSEFFQWIQTQNRPLDNVETSRRLAGLLVALRKAHREGADDPSLTYQLNKVLQRLHQTPLTFNDHLEWSFREDRGKTIDYVNAGMNYVRAFDSLQDALEKRRFSHKRFFEDTMAPVPVGLAGAIKGPTGVFLEDLLDWNSRMLDTTFDGLDVVSDAVRTGEVDHDRVSETEQKLGELARTGPWTEESGKRFVIRMGEQIPGFGRISNLVW